MTQVEWIINRFKKQRDLSKEEIMILKNERLINGIWPKNHWLNKFMKKLKTYPLFQESKYEQLLDRIRYESYKHDLDFYIGWGFITFTITNIRFAWNVTHLCSWTRFYIQFAIFFVLVILLEIRWWKYFRWWKK